MAYAYLAKYKTIAADVKTLQELLKPHDFSTVKVAGNLAEKIETQMRKAHEEDGNTEWEAEAIVKSGIENILDVFFDALSWRKKEASSLGELRETSNGQRLLSTYVNVLRCVTFFTDNYTSFCEFAIEHGLIKATTDELNQPELLLQRSPNNNSFYDDFYVNYLLILSNITGRTTKAVANFDKKSIGVLKTYCEGTNYPLMTLALFTLCCIAAENEKISISDQLATHIVLLLKAALKGDFSGFSFYLTTTELLESLCQVANCSDNCVTKLVDAGIMDALDAILTAPAPQQDSKADRFVHEPPKDKTKLVEFTNDKEKLLAIKLCWMAKFTKSVREVLITRKTTVEALETLAKTASNQDIQSEATNLLTSMFEKRKDPDAAHKNDGTAKSNETRPESGRLLAGRRQATPRSLQKVEQDGLNDTTKRDSEKGKRRDRIFVSYSHKQQQLVFSIVDKLRAAGFKNVITDQSIESDWYTWMVEQVEQADIVLVCFSKAYYESGNCKDEATNARALGKKIIPLKMEDYTPISWLGGITRVRLWRDYWIPNKFDDSVSKLIGEITKHSTDPDDVTDLAHSPRSTSKLQSKHSHDSIVSADPTKAAQAQSSVSAYKPSESGAEQLSNVNSWDEQKTKQWLEAIDYPAAQVRPGALNGSFIITLVHFARSEPKFLLELLLQHKGVSLDQALLIVGKLAAGRNE